MEGSSVEVKWSELKGRARERQGREGKKEGRAGPAGQGKAKQGSRI